MSLSFLTALRTISEMAQPDLSHDFRGRGETKSLSEALPQCAALVQLNLASF
jgi:hypothetical protein